MIFFILCFEFLPAPLDFLLISVVSRRTASLSRNSTSQSLRCTVLTLPRALPVPRTSRSTCGVAFSLAYPPIRRLRSDELVKSRKITKYLAHRPLASYKPRPLSVRVFYQSTSTVSCGVHLVFLQPRATRQRCRLPSIIGGCL